jgi:hypothetical protein
MQNLHPALFCIPRFNVFVPIPAAQTPHYGKTVRSYTMASAAATTLLKNCGRQPCSRSAECARRITFGAWGIRT